MIVRTVKQVEDCFDGSFIKEFILSEPSDEDFMRKLSRGCALDYYPDFPRPFFRIENRGVWVIKGVEGSESLRVLFSRNASNKDVRELVRLLENM
jgi:hypothetical protein